jgi:hypothetical protein
VLVAACSCSAASGRARKAMVHSAWALGTVAVER